MDIDRADGDHSTSLGAQHQHPGQHDAEEEEHFEQVCRSYRQCATFHQTRLRGASRRVLRSVALSRRNDGGSSANGRAAGELPTVESILPPALLPQTRENDLCNKQFCDATIRNQFFLDSVLKYSGVMTSQELLRLRRDRNDGSPMEWATEEQISKVDSVLKSVARDWSSEGSGERSAVYDRLVAALKKYVPLEATPCDDGGEEANVPPPRRVAVPGSGLGRLAWEIYSRGYEVEGSDFFLPMLLASDFMLNGCRNPAEGSATDAARDRASSLRKFDISPWISETRNVVSFQDRVRAVAVPDVDPASITRAGGDGDRGELAAPEFTMMAGEFLSLYSRFLPRRRRARDANSRRDEERSKRFHAVACSFFLDTAPSLPHYLITIYHMLESGGLLLHFGPLMYHWSGHGGLLPGDLNDRTNADATSDSISGIYEKRNKHLDPRYLSSVDYTWEEVKFMILRCGFEIEEEETNIPARYTSDTKGMMKVDYDCTFLVARKK